MTAMNQSWAFKIAEYNYWDVSFTDAIEDSFS